MPEEKVLEKTIVPTNLSFRDIKPGFGKKFDPFTVYEITGNDTVKYETADKKYYETFKIGVPAEVKYVVKSTNSNGRVFTSYRLVGPVREKPETQRVMDRLLQVESSILSEIRRAEKNIIRAIELNSKGVAVSIEDDFPQDEPTPEDKP